MNILINIDSFESRYVIYSPPIKNKVKTFGMYYKILYSNECLTISSLYIHIPMVYINLKNGIYIGMTEKATTLVSQLELQLLSIFNTTIKKHIIFTRFEPPHAYSKHKIKSMQLLLSGIWETETKIGMVYKYIIQYKYPP